MEQDKKAWIKQAQKEIEKKKQKQRPNNWFDNERKHRLRSRKTTEKKKGNYNKWINIQDSCHIKENDGTENNMWDSSPLYNYQKFGRRKGQQI